MLVFVPLAPTDLAAWAAGAPRTVTGFAATPLFCDTFEVVSADSEDADLTLLEIAGIAGLQAHGVRLVAVCDVDAVGAEPAEFGGVTAQGVPYALVESLFADDAQTAQRVAALAPVVAPLTLDQAWETDEVTDLLRTTELLWHGPGEWETLV